MEYEHTSAEELKEVAEREAAEMAEREENWEHEREQLKVSHLSNGPGNADVLGRTKRATRAHH